MKWEQLGMGDKNGVIIVSRPWGARSNLIAENYIAEANYTIDSTSHPLEQVKGIMEGNLNSNMLRIVVNCFGKIPIERQCELAHKCRALRESRRDGAPTQFFFDAGRWNWIDFEKEWQRSRVGSPFLHQAHLRIDEPLNREEVWKYLSDANCVSNRQSSLDELCCDLVTEFTGGRIPLVHAVVDHLKVRGVGDIEHSLHSVLEEVIGLHEVIDAIAAEWNRLSDGSRKVIAITMYCHLYRTRLQDINVVEAILSGLVVETRQPAGASYTVLAPSCKCVELVIRRDILRLNIAKENLADIGDSCVTVMAHAYRKTLEIECLLRQLLVSYWTARNLSLHEAMQRIPIKKPKKFISVADLYKEGQRAACEVAKGIDVPANNSSVITKRTLFMNAEAWQNRQRSRLDQPDISLMAYATAGDLEKALENNDVGIIASDLTTEDRPFNKEALKSIMNRFRPIRDAVAHCQPLSISAITALDVIREEITKMIAMKAESFLPRGESPVEL